jgi:class 3 adenylate cyclase
MPARLKSESPVAAGGSAWPWNWNSGATSPRPAARNTSPALAQILAVQARRNERRLNGFRAAIWSSVGLITGGAGLLTGGGISPGSALALLWGIVSAILGLTLLRHYYRDWLAAVLSTIDITLLAWCMDAGHRYLLRTDPTLVSHQLYASGIVLLALLTANVLRFSWRLSLWSVAYGAFAYWFILWRNHAIDVLSYVELTAFVLLGWMLAYSARKLGSIVRQVVERDALTRYLPLPVVDRITRDPGAINLDGESQVITALFSDLRGFTALAEDMAPDAVVSMLNEYFGEMAAEIANHGGIPMQYSGDSLYVVFPAAGGVDHARRAIAAAQGMLQRLESLNARRLARNLPPLGVGIGLHTGPVVGGPIGSPELLHYTYIGDTVNIASRIEHMTRDLQRPLLVSGPTLEMAGGPAGYRAELVGNVSLRGRRETLPLWAVS